MTSKIIAVRIKAGVTAVRGACRCGRRFAIYVVTLPHEHHDAYSCPRCKRRIPIAASVRRAQERA
jgi:hypothetical protein